MNRLKDFDLNAVLLAVIMAALLMVFLSGCTTQKKVNKWLDNKPKEKTESVVARYMTLNELFAAAFCARTFPVSESEVIPGAETVTESEEVQTETVPCKDEAGNRIEYVEVPKVRVVTKTVQRTDTIRVRDRAQERAYQLQELETQKALTKETEAHTATLQALEETRQERNRAYWFGGILITAIIGFVAIKVFKPF